MFFLKKICFWKKYFKCSPPDGFDDFDLQEDNDDNNDDNNDDDNDGNNDDNNDDNDDDNKQRIMKDKHCKKK